jgi:hypothetical protein
MRYDSSRSPATMRRIHESNRVRETEHSEKTMKRHVVVLSVSLFIAVTGFASEQRPHVVNIDGIVSIDVDGVALGRLLRLWDQATGMQSSIPAELANRTISISFSGLRVNDAIRRMFETVGFDYVFIPGRGIIVTAVSQAGGAEPAPVYEEPVLVTSQVLDQEFPQAPPEPPRPPVMHTPFGPIVTSGRNPFIHLPPIPGETSPPAFFAPEWPAPASPQGNLFGPISIHQNPGLPPLSSQPPR